MFEKSILRQSNMRKKIMSNRLNVQKQGQNWEKGEYMCAYQNFFNAFIY